MKRLLLLLLLLATGAFGCAASTDEEDAESSQGAVRTTEDIAAAFAIQYGGLGGRFRSVDRERLPEGDASEWAACLAAHRDVVRGKTLETSTWKYENATYFVVEVEVEPNEELRDPVMVNVFFDDGRPAFQAIAWDRKHSVKLYLEPRSPC